jgi:hypothetical protein
MELFFSSLDSFIETEDIFMIILLFARMKLFVSPLVYSLKTYDSFLFIDKQQTKANMLTLMLHETILII